MTAIVASMGTLSQGRMAPLTLVALVGCLLLNTGCAPSGMKSEPAAEPVATRMDHKLTQSQIGGQFSRGLEAYRLSPGDTLEVLFYVDRRPSTEEYVIGVGDRLFIDFYYQPDVSRSLVVRPDGIITLPIHGDILAAGLTPTVLSEAIQHLFINDFRRPQVTVRVDEYSTPLSRIQMALGTTNTPRVFSIMPDGRVFLPLLGAISIAGLSLEEAEQQISAAYTQKYGGVGVSMLLSAMEGNRVFVFGDVTRPGVQRRVGSMTVMQAIAAAGGPLPSASLSKVRVVRFDPRTGQTLLDTVDVNAALSDPASTLLANQAVVYVPPKTVARLGRVVDQYVRQLFLFNGVSLGFSYQLNDERFVIE